ncbi:MAG: hypothetical protein K5644_09210 [Lachnospiraceae bacterium]|nr:hypothetical protein [Lachnospiraceae bacterium]
MDDYLFIDKFIPSKDTKAYLHSIDYKFTELEKATIVANHYLLPAKEKIAWLQECSKATSDKDLKKRISNAITCIKKHKKHERKGWYYYNDALFDFVFIPHDFRNGDIVTCLYGDWDTTRYNEKIGIILGYFDDNYRCYKKMAGDYSDTQICVDIKFDGVNYQGEFEHEHINPIYIERMNLHKNDERIPYINYLALVYKEKYDYDALGDGSPEYARLHRSLTIYKDDRYEVMIDFYDKPAEITLLSDGEILLTVGINKEFISGRKALYESFAKWLEKNDDKLTDIVWEWNLGNEDFELISEELII